MKAELRLTDALLARSVDYAEADRVCTFLTRTVGKVTALARSARRSRRRFGGALGLFVVGEAALRKGRGELLVLERFEAREDLSARISADVIKVAHGGYVLEVARELWPAEQRDPALFELVVETLRALSLTPPSANLLRAFELKALAVCGVLPALERCAGCDRPLDPGPLTLDAGRGGAICARCAPPGDEVAAVACAGLLQLLRTPIDRVVEHPKTDPAAARVMRGLMLDAVRLHLGRDLQSLRFIAQLAGRP